MDVDNISGTEQFTASLRQQKQTLEAAQRRHGTRPSDMKPLSLLIHEFMIVQTSQQLMRSPNPRNEIHQSWVAAPYSPSVEPLKTLKKLHIKDLRLETHHRGNYIMLRVATPPNTMTAVMVIAEDEQGSGVMLMVYQQGDTEYGLAEDIAQVGGVCIVKEPYFKTMSNGGYGVRVDHITDIVWLAEDDEMVPFRWGPRNTGLKETAMELKVAGNAALKARDLNKAVQCYTKALKCAATKEENQILKLNRSLAYLKLRHYDEALVDATGISEEHEVSEKGAYRAARSLYELQMFEKCREILVHLLDNYKNNTEAKEQLLRTEERLSEQTRGQYDFKAMYKAAEKTPPCLDNATYTGSVAIKASEGRGRGLFTTRDVAAGELLICEKAFAYCFASEEVGAGSSKTSLLMNLHTKRGTVGTQADLITAVVQKMLRNPSQMPSFSALHRGNYKPVKETEVDGLPIVDTFLVEAIIALNVFGCPRSTLKFHFGHYSPEQLERQKHHHTTGIFLKASPINHSCHSNARRSFIGDMIIVRATRDIPAATEISFWYAPPEPGRTWEKTQESLRHWGFQCSCIWCQQDKKTPKKTHTKRMTLLEDLKAAFQTSGSTNLSRTEKIITAIEKTYSAPATDIPRLELADPYLLLTRIHTSHNRPQPAIQTAFKALTSLGFVIAHHAPDPSFAVLQWGLPQEQVIETWTHVWTACDKIAPHLCEKAEGYARISYRICVGEDETFEETMGKMVRESMQQGEDLGTAFMRMNLG